MRSILTRFSLLQSLRDSPSFSSGPRAPPARRAGPLDALPAPGGDVEVGSVSQGPGGSALNTAWHLAAQDVHATLHAAVGKDRMAQVLSNALRVESKVVNSSKTLAVLERESTAACVSMFGPRVDRTFLSTAGQWCLLCVLVYCWKPQNT